MSSVSDLVASRGEEGSTRAKKNIPGPQWPFVAISHFCQYISISPHKQTKNTRKKILSNKPRVQTANGLLTNIVFPPHWEEINQGSDRNQLCGWYVYTFRHACRGWDKWARVVLTACVKKNKTKTFSCASRWSCVQSHYLPQLMLLGSKLAGAED